MSKILHGKNILLIAKNAPGLTPLTSYLSGYKTKIWTASSMPEAVKKIEERGIDVVLLSINMPNVEIEKVYIALNSKYKMPTVVFAEEINTATTNRISIMPVKHKIVPPNHNVKFLREIVTLLSAETTEKRAVKTESLLPRGAKPTDGKDRPKSDSERWICLNPDNPDPTQYTFKLIPGRNASVSLVRYYWIGDKAPTDPEAKGQMYESGRTIQYTTRDGVKAQMTAAEAATVEAQVIQMGEPARDQLETIEVCDVEPTNLIEKCLKEAADVVAADGNGPAATEADAQRFLITLVKTTISEGFVVANVGVDEIYSLSAFSELIDIFRANLRKAGVSATEISPPIFFEQSALDFIPWLRANSYYLVSAQTPQLPFTCVLVRASLDDVVLELKDEHMYALPSSVLHPQINITFDLHLRLEANNKYVLYKRAGTEITPTIIKSLETHGIEKLYVRATDKNLYYAYHALARMRKKDTAA